MTAVVKPSALRIDASTLCQLRCPECPNGRRTLAKSDVGLGFLSVEDFEGVVVENPSVCSVELSNWGEPFLNPRLLEIIALAYRKGVRLGAQTNLNRVDDAVLEGLVRYRFDRLVISLDGTTAETYRAYRVGGCLETVLSNVRRINALKLKHRSRFPRLTWQFLVFGHNEHEIDAARTIARSLQMDFAAWLPTNMYTRPDTYEPVFSPVRNKDLVRAELGYATLDELKEHSGAFRDQGVCLQLWDRPAINWDGAVLGCCVTTQAFGGNAFRDGLVRSINEDVIGYARQMVTGAAPPKPGVPCSTCPVYQLMQKDGSWVKPTKVDVLRRGRALFRRKWPRLWIAASMLRDQLG